MSYSQSQLAQYSLNMALGLQNAIISGEREPAAKGTTTVILAAIVALAEAVLNQGGPTTVPNSLTGGTWSYAQSPNAPIQT